jgi:hypothetical protein
MPRRDDNKMIEVDLRFWTNNLGDQPKHAWAAGMVFVRKNTRHGIGSSRRFSEGVPFHSVAQISSAVEKALKAQGVKLNAKTNGMKKLYV